MSLLKLDRVGLARTIGLIELCLHLMSCSSGGTADRGEVGSIPLGAARPQNADAARDLRHPGEIAESAPAPAVPPPATSGAGQMPPPITAIPSPQACTDDCGLCTYQPDLPPAPQGWSDFGNSFVGALTAEDLGGLVRATSDGGAVFAVGGASVPSTEDNAHPGTAFRTVTLGRLNPTCELVWSRSFAVGADTRGIWPLGLALDARERLVLTGAAYGPIDFDGAVSGQADRVLFALQLDGDGTSVWSRRFGPREDDGAPSTYPMYTARPVAGPDGELLVYGFGTSDDGLGESSDEATVSECANSRSPGNAVGCGFLMALNADDGEPLFAQRFPSTYPGSVIVGAQGALLFSAVSRVDWVGGGSDLGPHLLAKLNASRRRVWSTAVADPQTWTRFMGSDWHWDRTLALDSEQNVFYLRQQHDGSEPKALTLLNDVRGWRIDKFNTGGERVWPLDVAGWQVGTPAGMATTMAGDVVVAGHFAGTADFGSGALQAQGERDGFIVKLDASGHLRWARRYGGDAGDFIGAVDVAHDHNIWITGWSGVSMPYEVTRADLPGTRVRRHAAFIAKLSP